jgi:hypothetical protein
MLSVGRATDYGLDGRASIPGRGRRFSYTSQRPDWLWVPSSLLSNGYWVLFTREKSCRGMKLTTHLLQVPRSRMVELYLHFPIYVFKNSVVKHPVALM